MVDCNNFYASCEKLFDPKLRDRPVVVLSNNDGCAVARSAEAKALGIKMGVPWFKMRDEALKHGIVAKSSNYSLYADMSNRVVDVLRAFAPRIEVYSIDESFLDLSGFNYWNLTEYGQQIRQRVSKWVGLPVCVGIGPTKTLSKMANHIAKKQPKFNGVCNLAETSPEATKRLFEGIDVGEVWGVGYRLTARLNDLGIRTVQDLRDTNPIEIRRKFNVVLERTVRELQGTPCIELEEVSPDKQQIISSRSFGKRVTCYEEMAEAMATYVGRAAEKLRRQNGATGAITVWVETNPFDPNARQYSRSRLIPLPAPTDDTLQLTRVALWGLKRIYRDGYEYKKCGCMLSEIVPIQNTQRALFVSNGGKSDKLVAALDAVNAKYGRGTLKSAAEGITKDWQMRRGNVSPAYTTRWLDIVPVQ